MNKIFALIFLPIHLAIAITSIRKYKQMERQYFVRSDLKEVLLVIVIFLWLLGFGVSP